MIGKVQDCFSPGDQADRPTKKDFGFLSLPRKKQSVSATVNHQVGGSSLSLGAIIFLGNDRAD